jgi:hypothetical protein
MGQTTQQPPQVGQVANGYQWNGVQWIPLGPPPQVGQVANGYQWNGVQWIPLGAPPQVGQVANGYQWNGVQWIPLGPPPQPAAEAVLVGEILRYAQAAGFTVQQSAQQLTLQRVVAERKAFLSTAKLEYRATISLDDARRTARFTELLKESGSGLTSGGGEDGDFGTATGFGFQKSTYNSRTDGIAESIEEQAARLGTKYAPGFPYAEVKGQLGRMCAAAGYSFS